MAIWYQDCTDGYQTKSSTENGTPLRPVPAYSSVSLV